MFRALQCAPEVGTIPTVPLVFGSCEERVSTSAKLGFRHYTDFGKRDLPLFHLEASNALINSVFILAVPDVQ
ncbi:MAG: hypothetical protein ACLR6J_14775 [Parabacteroides merdae]